MALFVWVEASDNILIGKSLGITEPVAFLASITLLASGIGYFFTPPKFVQISAYTIYLMTASTIVTLVVMSGYISSPYIALWMLIAIFAGIFGMNGLVPLFIVASSYFVYLYLNGGLTRDATLTTMIVGVLPLILSAIIWHYRTNHESTKDRAYRELANELDQVATRSEVVINAIGDGVITVDGKGTVQLMNPAAQRIIGRSKDDTLGLDYKLILKLTTPTGDEVTTTNDPVYKVLNENHPERDDHLFLETAGRKKLAVSVIVSPIGQPGTGALIVFRDITKEKQEEREQAEFISTASHEMRTPVASIEGYLGLALNPATASIDDKAREFIQKAQESAQHLGRLFQDLLDVTRAEDGRLTSNPSVIDLVTYTQTIIEGLRPKASEKGLQVIFKPQPNDDDSNRTLTPVFYVHLDNDHLREVISNLTENAIKYTPRGTVTVDVKGDDETVTVSVADSGIGIPAEDIPHLFQKFYRVDNTDTREIGGTGLGLYLCRRLVESMSGKIWVKSEYQKGSTFYVELPRISHEEASRIIEENASIEAAKNNQAIKDSVAPASPEAGPIASDPTAVPNAATSQPNYAQNSNAAPEQYVRDPQLQSPPQQPTSQPVVAPNLNYAAPTSSADDTLQPTHEPSNMTLAEIENNPAQYAQSIDPQQRASGVNIPPRE